MVLGLPLGNCDVWIPPLWQVMITSWRKVDKVEMWQLKNLAFCLFCDPENCFYMEFVVFMVWSHELTATVRLLVPCYSFETVLLQALAGPRFTAVLLPSQDCWDYRHYHSTWPLHLHLHLILFFPPPSLPLPFLPSSLLSFFLVGDRKVKLPWV